VDVEPLLRDFDGYEKELAGLAVDQESVQALESGKLKRIEAASLLEEGEADKALPVIEKAIADARAALEMERMGAAARRAENCRLEVEQTRSKWRESIYVLEQTESFVGEEAKVSKAPPESRLESPDLPPSTLTPTAFPPAAASEVSRNWTAWQQLAGEHRIAMADLESAYLRSYVETQWENADQAVVEHHLYLAARTVQSLECRVRGGIDERVCLEATRITAELGDARADALQATLDLERGLQDNLRLELDKLRVEAETRQDELFEALSRMEGKFASIRRDARGTIVSLADILFDFDKSTLRRDVEFNLVKIATILNQFGEMGILIEGHTDSIGTEEYNLGLSQRRAEAVYEFLGSQDVDPSRMSWEGYGEGRPVADNNSEEGRQRNRRVDLVIQDAP
jgi:outer membrane protein OmpA-like peptidoglycan-associated protein